ncbi:MAG: hypothetical protein B0D96_00930 [Candidatus Sedimenticola endophacoides]|nr:MAG: hypothetical protein B0D96_00930 [Candidatus Sedimenticola endophacoides]
MIDDKELCDLFKAESEEHIQNLEAGFLRLEKKPDDQPTLDEVFREAHSLKGASRMLDLSNIELVAHSMEDVLRAASKRELRITPEVIDRLYQGLDGIRKLVTEELAGTPADLDIAQVMGVISGEIDLPPGRGAVQRRPPLASPSPPVAWPGPPVPALQFVSRPCGGSCCHLPPSWRASPCRPGLGVASLAVGRYRLWQWPAERVQGRARLRPAAGWVCGRWCCRHWPGTPASPVPTGSGVCCRPGRCPVRQGSAGAGMRASGRML